MEPKYYIPLVSLVLLITLIYIVIDIVHYFSKPARLLRVLRKLDRTHGGSICSQVIDTSDIDTVRMLHVVQRITNQRLGISRVYIMFPVSHPTKTSSTAYIEAERNDKFWEGEYGDNRRNYLDELIKTCEEL